MKVRQFCFAEKYRMESFEAGSTLLFSVRIPYLRLKDIEG